MSKNIIEQAYKAATACYRAGAKLEPLDDFEWDYDPDYKRQNAESRTLFVRREHDDD